MNPPGISLGNDSGTIANHVVAIELPSGDLALIDTGIGSQARRDPVRYLGPVPGRAFRPDRDPKRSALAQLEAMGRSSAEVRHVLITHLDGDHASGLVDFPDATVHVHRVERETVENPPLRERGRFVAADWAHGPKWSELETSGGGDFEGIPSREIEGLEVEVLALELPGHTRGHTGYAVRIGDGWFVHAGDAFYHSGLLEPGGRQSRFFTLFERLVASQPQHLAPNHERLRALASRADVEVVCTHSPELLQRSRARTT
ncbi:MBL fold metallo-hydrolase [Thermoleophilia bacterium SCSIO 60948]|nr:MBL fold metallo-hydrolase [Thermoleophilia bacterium SCSIO 60948]